MSHNVNKNDAAIDSVIFIIHFFRELQKNKLEPRPQKASPKSKNNTSTHMKKAGMIRKNHVCLFHMCTRIVL